MFLASSRKVEYKKCKLASCRKAFIGQACCRNRRVDSLCSYAAYLLFAGYRSQLLPDRLFDNVKALFIRNKLNILDCYWNNNFRTGGQFKQKWLIVVRITYLKVFCKITKTDCPEQKQVLEICEKFGRVCPRALRRQRNVAAAKKIRGWKETFGLSGQIHTRATLCIFRASKSVDFRISCTSKMSTNGF